VIATSPDGTRIAWSEQGDGHPLLLIHGLGYAGSWGWGPVLAPLARRFRVLTFDNRGIGGSDRPPGPYSAALMADDALAVLQAAEVDGAHVVGTSLGGMVAQELALRHSWAVDNLVLACTTPGGTNAYPMPEQTVRLITQPLDLPPLERFKVFVRNALSEPYDETMVEQLAQTRIEEAQPLDAWQAQAAAGITHDALNRLAGIRAPTLVVTGTADEVVDPRNSELLADLIPNARLERVEGAGHLFFWQEPERFVSLLGEFLWSR
jgi:pimeloyl-ACP methyl ester carboxylesterase